MDLIWWACRPTGATALTEFRKELLSSWLRRKAYPTSAWHVPRVARRRYVMAGHEVKEIAASIVGMIQGCTLRVLLFDLVMNTWARSVKAETVTAMSKVHDDDAGVLSEVGEDVDVQKSKAWSTTETALQSARDFVLNVWHLDVVKKLTSPGIQHRCD